MAIPDFSCAPFLVVWEVTRACALACQHCRAAAIDQRDPDELTTAEGHELLRQTAAMGTPVCVLTGGDPLQRLDLEELIRVGTAAGLRMATIPAATERLTRERLASLARAGVAQVALSIDAPDAAAHDAFRGVPGSFARTVQAAHDVRGLGLPLQINTVFGGWNLDRVDAMARLVTALGVAFWEVFLLVPVGRGAAADPVGAGACERLFAELYAVAQQVDFVVKIAEAPHWRRYVMQRLLADGEAGEAPARVRRLLERPSGPGGAIGHSPRAVNAGRGFCFVSYRGDVCPSGFLPRVAGNVRDLPLAEIYRDNELFRALRDPERLRGRCGRCEFRRVCGGSRSRAFAVSGDPFRSDPCCAYRPGQMSPEAVAALTG